MSDNTEEISLGEVQDSEDPPTEELGLVDMEPVSPSASQPTAARPKAGPASASKLRERLGTKPMATPPPPPPESLLPPATKKRADTARPPSARASAPARSESARPARGSTRPAPPAEALAHRTSGKPGAVSSKHPPGSSASKAEMAASLRPPPVPEEAKLAAGPITVAPPPAAAPSSKAAGPITVTPPPAAGPLTAPPPAGDESKVVAPPSAAEFAAPRPARRSTAPMSRTSTDPGMPAVKADGSEPSVPVATADVRATEASAPNIEPPSRPSLVDTERMAPVLDAVSVLDGAADGGAASVAASDASASVATPEAQSEPAAKSSASSGSYPSVSAEIAAADVKSSETSGSYAAASARDVVGTKSEPVLKSSEASAVQQQLSPSNPVPPSFVEVAPPRAPKAPVSPDAVFDVETLFDDRLEPEHGAGSAGARTEASNATAAHAEREPATVEWSPTSSTRAAKARGNRPWPLIAAAGVLALVAGSFSTRACTSEDHVAQSESAPKQDNAPHVLMPAPEQPAQLAAADPSRPKPGLAPGERPASAEAAPAAPSQPSAPVVAPAAPAAASGAATANTTAAATPAPAAATTAVAADTAAGSQTDLASAGKTLTATQARPLPAGMRGGVVAYRASEEPVVDYKAKGRDYFSAGKYREAADAYQRASERAPSDSGAFAGLGASWLAAGQSDRAIVAYQRALQLKPDVSGFQAALGRAYLQKGDRGRAASAYRKALELDPQNSAARNGLEGLQK